MTDRNEFRRADLRAFELLGQARTLIGSDYWLFLGITVVGMILGSLVPLAILMGPFMVGIHLAYRGQERGEKLEFGVLFKGFDKFVESLVATLIIVFGLLILMSPAIVLNVVGIIGLSESNDEGAQVLFGLLLLAFYAVVFAFSVVVSALTMFVYPLIADRGVTGLDAVKLSLAAAWGNLWGVVRVALVNMLLGFVGTLACCVGAFFVLPFTMGLTWVTYRQVFPAESSS
jgi:hypothetical protein